MGNGAEMKTERMVALSRRQMPPPPIEGVGNEASRLSHGAKVKRGQLTSVQQGRYGTGPAPYGYRRGIEGEKPLMVDDREAEVVRMVFREYLSTRSTGKVVNYLHSKNIYTRKGNRWSRQAIAIILANRTYRGRVTYGEIETEGLHDPIIEPALFYKANALRERKKRNEKPIRRGKRKRVR
jgi:hypothetical protein